MTSAQALSDGLEASVHLLVPYCVACVQQFSPLARSGCVDVALRGSTYCSAGFSALDVNSLEFFHPYFCCL
ncbi:hypothetical protein ACRRTK_012243 [Alexandromys fortis]